MQLAGKTVLITGASQGIGAATARAFAAHGARLLLVARDRQRLTDVAATLPQAVVLPTDLAEPAQITTLAAQVLSLGGVDVLIHNAGIGLAAPIATLAPHDLRAVFEVNLIGPLLLTQALLPQLRQRPQAQVMLVSSVVGLRSLPYLGGYAASKAALDRLAEALRVELLDTNITVTLVRPGTTRTDFSQRRLGHGHERRRVQSRAATPEQVAAAMVRAAQHQSREVYVTLSDRLTVQFSQWFPALADRILARSFSWEEEPLGR